VVFKLERIPQFQLAYQHLEAEVLKNGAVTLENVRKTIIQIRESKLPDPKLLGNAGSFFMNPVVSKELFASIQAKHPTMPHYFVSDTEEKIPAGWLIEQCGWKGKQVGSVAVYEKQALVIVNKGGATGDDVVQLAASIQQSVHESFGITLNAEVNYI
jgi:UDP-N-acetylmuramate dehydrogenase